MNGALIPRPALEALGWTLLHFLWQGTLVAILLAVANSLLRKRTANARYALCCGAMLLLLMLPVATFYALYNPATPARTELAPQPQFTEERTGFHIGENDVLAGVVKQRSQSAGHDEIDVPVVGGLIDDPRPRRSLQPDALAIEDPTGFRIERFETAMGGERILNRHRLRHSV